MKPPKTWILIANGSWAQVYDYTPRTGPVLKESHTMIAPRRAEYADTPGRTYASVGPSRQSMVPAPAQDQALLRFARNIAEHLRMAVDQDAFERLVLIAGPDMLGMIRAELDTRVCDRIWLELDKDLTHMPLEKLKQYLADVL